ITTWVRDRIWDALDEFHKHKQAILDHHLHWGQKTVLDHFKIPKLELMQHIVPSISQVGSLLQWSADTTKHAHIKVVKDPASMTNNQDYSDQICHILNHDEKCRLFGTAVEREEEDNGSDDNDDNNDDNHNSASNDKVLQDLWSAKRKITDFFKVAAKAASFPTDAHSFPSCTIIAGLTAIHLNMEPKVRCQLIDEVACQFDLPDLCAALGDYVNREGMPYPLNCFHTFGVRQSSSNIELPFTELQVWWKVRVQQKSYYNPKESFLSFTIHAHPPDRDWKCGQYDAGILQVDEACQWLRSGIQGTSDRACLTCYWYGHYS
ncbi:hypothetical protein V8E55_006438, partial [Tylopilus felleus]